MGSNELTARDLAHITIRCAAVGACMRGERTFELSFGHVREPYISFVKARSNKADAFLPFSDYEWNVLADTENLWRTIKKELDMLDDGARRITISVSDIPFDEWNAQMTSSVAHTLCFGAAMYAFKVIEPL